MATVSTSEFKAGLKIMLDGSPCAIIENEFFKPGKGQAYNRVKFRNLKSGRVLDRTFKSGDTVELADVLDIELQYLYNDGEYWHFMQATTFEQYAAAEAAMQQAAPWLKGEEQCVVTLFNNVPLSVQPPNFVELRITEIEPGVRGDTASGGTKPATLETGAIVKVPLFLERDEAVRIDTRTGEYVSRAKE